MSTAEYMHKFAASQLHAVQMDIELALDRAGLAPLDVYPHPRRGLWCIEIEACKYLVWRKLNVVENIYDLHTIEEDCDGQPLTLASFRWQQ